MKITLKDSYKTVTPASGRYLTKFPADSSDYIQYDSYQELSVPAAWSDEQIKASIREVTAAKDASMYELKAQAQEQKAIQDKVQKYAEALQKQVDEAKERSKMNALDAVSVMNL